MPFLVLVFFPFEKSALTIKINPCQQAPKSSPGPHKGRESFPMTLFLRNRLKYALSYAEVKKIVKQRLIKVDGKIRTDNTFPTGFMGMNFVQGYFIKGLD